MINPLCCFVNTFIYTCGLSFYSDTNIYQCNYLYTYEILILHDLKSNIILRKKLQKDCDVLSLHVCGRKKIPVLPQLKWAVTF